ncbi:MAG TPA: hypothetical protein VF532_15320 [Candidatus Angelobacter sp.]
MRFEVKLGDRVIGFSEFEYGDPSMGCASGRLFPTPAYNAIQKYCIEHFENWVPPDGLTVSLPRGEPIECAGGIQIEDIGSDEIGIEISMMGVTNPPFAELFPQHLAAPFKKP